MVKKKNHIRETTLEEAKLWGNAEYMEEGLILTDNIANAPIPQEPTRMNFIMMALCRRGKAQYSIDTCEQTVHPGDLLRHHRISSVCVSSCPPHTIMALSRT